jgi:hypothetical protein
VSIDFVLISLVVVVSPGVGMRKVSNQADTPATDALIHL